MSERSINSPIAIIDLVSAEETEDILLKKIFRIKERITTSKKKFVELKEKEKMLPEEITKVDIETILVKRRIADID